MTKALYPLILLAPIVAACIPIEKPVISCGPVAAAAITETIYTKDGFPIIIEPPIPVPCVASGVQITNPPTDNPPEPPVVDPEPPIVPEPTTPPKPAKVKCNDGRGNGSEGSPDCDAGRSGAVNHGGD